MAKKELVAQQSTALATQEATLEAWGAAPVSSKDIVIPKILCMQGLSDLVADEKAKMGDFVDSLTDEVLGNYVSNPIEFIPFHLEKIWIISEKVAGSDFKFKEIIPITAHNENLPYSEVVDGVELKREYTRNFYVLLPNDMSLPYIISFKGTSAKAGKQLATQMFIRNAAEGKVPPAKVMALSGFKDKNDKGTFIVMQTNSVRESSQEEIAQAFNWYKTVSSGRTKAHEEAEDIGGYADKNVAF